MTPRSRAVKALEGNLTKLEKELYTIEKSEEEIEAENKIKDYISTWFSDERKHESEETL